jgi:hypothetical protein
MQLQPKTLNLQRDTKYFVSLGSSINHERWISYSKNETISESLKPNDFIYYAVYDLKEAINLCRSFIKEFNLGASNWTGGRVCDDNMNFIACVSYNGRVWDNEDWRIAKEIEL